MPRFRPGRSRPPDVSVTWTARALTCCGDERKAPLTLVDADPVMNHDRGPRPPTAGGYSVGGSGDGTWGGGGSGRGGGGLCFECMGAQPFHTNLVPSLTPSSSLAQILLAIAGAAVATGGAAASWKKKMPLGTPLAARSSGNIT